MLINVQHILGYFMHVRVKESCSKNPKAFLGEVNFREVGKSLGWCVYCMPRCVSVKKVCWVVQRAGSWLMGKGKVPAGSICLWVKHQTFTSAYQLFSALHCQSVSVPQWQTTKVSAWRQRLNSMKRRWKRGWADHRRRWEPEKRREKEDTKFVKDEQNSQKNKQIWKVVNSWQR